MWLNDSWTAHLSPEATEFSPTGAVASWERREGRVSEGLR